MPMPVKEETCSKCGEVWEPSRPPNALRDLVFRKKSYIRLDEYLKVTCPRCGNTQDAQGRRFFFGLLAPSAVRYLVGAIVVAILIATAMVIYHDLARM